MEKTTPTRNNLMRLKTMRSIVINGREILKNRRESLLKEFFQLIDECMEEEVELDRKISRATKTLEFAKAMNLDDLTSLSIIEKRDFYIDVEQKHIWGVNVPEIKEKPVVRSLEAREISPIVENGSSIAVTRQYEEVMEQVIKMASKETRLNRLGEMIRLDSRKINALGEIMIPSIQKRIKEMNRIFEEREKEDILRLKWFKDKRQRKQKES
ncbi:MAG: V-type ATP synthase subunit D [Leptospirales bacterium]